jgi:hypothetical protein
LPADMGLPLVGSAGLGFLLGLTRRWAELYKYQEDGLV